MKNKHVVWILVYGLIVGSLLVVVFWGTYSVDPFFHFHEPKTERFFYPLNNQRSQNDGITKHFDYDGLITGTSMTENFKTSEAERIFGGKFIKVPYSGGSFKEINDNIEVALSHNRKLNKIIRGLDIGMIFYGKDQMREDLGTYPTYLYDDNIFNDVRYVFNRDVIFSRVYPMIQSADTDTFNGGITSFDTYSNWMNRCTFGRMTVYPDGVDVKEKVAKATMNQEERNIVLENVCQNVTRLANEYPDVTFYYFFTPYSIQWWQRQVENGTLDKQLEAEKIVIEEILKYENIKLYSFALLTDIITDLNNYKDITHYGEWINSLILKYISEDQYMLTYENYEDYLLAEKEFYSTYDYSELNNQEDYVNDYYAAALLNEEINNVVPYELDIYDYGKISMTKAEIVSDQYSGDDGIMCVGSLERTVDSEISVSDYLRDNEYVGFKYLIEDLTPYSYLVFYGRKVSGHGQPSVYVYDKDGMVRKELVRNYKELDDDWHQYLIDISDVEGSVTIIFNGGYVDSTGDAESKYIFSNVTLY